MRGGSKLPAAYNHVNTLGNPAVEGVQMVNTRFSVLAFFLLVGCGGEPFGASFGATGPTTGGSAGSAVEETDSGASGGAVGAGGASTGGETDADSGAAGGTVGAGGALPDEDAGAGGASHGSGGSLAMGGKLGAGGVPVEADAACALVTHDNGLGQTWQDCVALGTYDENQAMKACMVSGAMNCQTVAVCGSALPEVRGYSTDGSKIIGRWGYQGVLAGYVGTGTLGELCFGASDPKNRKWH
jgi:hypothetical protein